MASSISEVSTNALIIIRDAKKEYLNCLNRLLNLQSNRLELTARMGQRSKTEILCGRVAQDFPTSGINYRTRLLHQLQLETEEVNRWVAIVRECEASCLLMVEGIVNQLQRLVFTVDRDILQVLKWSGLSTSVSVAMNNVQQLVTECIETIVSLESFLQQSFHSDTSGVSLFQNDQDIHSRDRRLVSINQLGKLKQTIMMNSMIVNNQPPQLIRQGTKFETSVMFLGGRFIPTGEVKAVLLNESQAIQLYAQRDPNVIEHDYYEIKNNLGKPEPECSNSPSPLVYNFSNVAITKINREDATKAMREKYCLLVSTKLEIGGQYYSIWCCSVPFVYSVHANQAAEGLGTIFYDHAFRESYRIPFAVPDAVPWSRFITELDQYFKAATNSPRGLTETNKRCIGKNIFGTSDFTATSTITQTAFLDKTALRKFGFWGWFYSYVRLINKHLQPYWDNGYIIGFVNFDEVEQSIFLSDAGTFMVRFSQSLEGAVVITVGVTDEANAIEGGHQIKSECLALHNADLKMMSISNRIRSYYKYNAVYHLTVNEEGIITPKEVAFQPPSIGAPITTQPQYRKWKLVMGPQGTLVMVFD